MNSKIIDIEIVKRYLNIKGDSQEILSIFDSVCNEIFALSQPKKICVLSEATIKNGYYNLQELGLTLKSNDLRDVFVQCDKIAVLAVTLGSMVDKKIVYYSKCDVFRSLVMDAVASVYVENVMDELENEFLQNYPNKYHTMRFSPGYGDFDLSVQRDLLETISANKILGITVNESFLMTPMKSITAFIGLSDIKQPFSNVCVKCPLNGKCNTKCAKANVN